MSGGGGEGWRMRRQHCQGGGNDGGTWDASAADEALAGVCW